MAPVTTALVTTLENMAHNVVIRLF